MTISSAPQPPLPRGHRLRPWLILLIVLVLALLLAIVPRLHTRAATDAQTQLLAEPTVQVTHAVVAPANQSLQLPGTVMPYRQAAIYARASGYVGQWFTDIGSKVGKGQRLATLQAPELDAELAQARAQLASAQADFRIAQVTAERWQGLLKHNAVSEQQTQDYLSAMQTKQALLHAAQANVQRLVELQGFLQVTAPFAGTITVRNIDIGSLVDAGNGGSPRQALFELAQTDRLRVYVQVPQQQADGVVVGTRAGVSLPQYPGQSFDGTVVRTAGAFDPVSRSLRVEVDLDNAKGLIPAGAYAQVSLTLRAPHPGLSLPLNTLVLRPNGVHVATVDAQGRVRLLPVTLGRDFGTRIEITTGLRPQVPVILNPGDAIAAGEPVHVVPGGEG